MSIHVMIGTNPDSTTELSRENLTLEVDLTLLVACVYTKPSLTFGAIARRSFPRAPHTQVLICCTAAIGLFQQEAPRPATRTTGLAQPLRQ